MGSSWHPALAHLACSAEGQVDVNLPDGERFWHHVVRLHRAAMMVLVDGQDRVLLLWLSRRVRPVRAPPIAGAAP